VWEGLADDVNKPKNKIKKIESNKKIKYKKLFNKIE